VSQLSVLCFRDRTREGQRDVGHSLFYEKVDLPNFVVKTPNSMWSMYRPFARLLLLASKILEDNCIGKWNAELGPLYSGDCFTLVEGKIY